MIVDIHKPDTSTLVTTGHFYFGWTQVTLEDLTFDLGLTHLRRNRRGSTPSFSGRCLEKQARKRFYLTDVPHHEMHEHPRSCLR